MMHSDNIEELEKKRAEYMKVNIDTDNPLEIYSTTQLKKELQRRKKQNTKDRRGNNGW